MENDCSPFYSAWWNDPGHARAVRWRDERRLIQVHFIRYRFALRLSLYPGARDHHRESTIPRGPIFVVILPVSLCGFLENDFHRSRPPLL